MVASNLLLEPFDHEISDYLESRERFGSDVSGDLGVAGKASLRVYGKVTSDAGSSMAG